MSQQKPVAVDAFFSNYNLHYCQSLSQFPLNWQFKAPPRITSKQININQKDKFKIRLSVVLFCKDSFNQKRNENLCKIRKFEKSSVPIRTNWRIFRVLYRCPARVFTVLFYCFSCCLRFFLSLTLLDFLKPKYNSSRHRSPTIVT